MLDKTQFGYLVREAADVTGLSYSGDFAAEVWVYLDRYLFQGDYGEVMRHGDQACSFGAVPGWTLHTGNSGYLVETETTRLYATVNDGTGNLVQTSTDLPKGAYLIRFEFTAATGGLRLLVNGLEVDVNANASVSMPATLSDICIGGNNKVHARYASQFGTYPCPFLQMQQATIYGPGMVPVSRWNFQGDATDSVGTNDLTIVHAHPSGPIPVATNPSGSIQLTSADENGRFQADGVVGVGAPVEYLFEVSQSSGFSNAVSSGWQMSNKWKGPVDPGATYWVRVKCRDANLLESGWSSTSQAARSAKEHFVRPLDQSTTYGLQDGTSYANAFNGMRNNGGQRGVQTTITIAQWQGQLDEQEVIPGDTVWMSDEHGLVTLAAWPATNFPKQEAFRLVGTGNNPIQLRYDHGTNPGRGFKFFRWSGDHAWQSEGGGRFSSAEYPTFSLKAIGVGTTEPATDLSDWKDDSLLYEDTGQTLAAPGWYITGGRIHVRLEDDSNPTGKLWFLITDGSTYRPLPLSCKYVDTHRADFLGTYFGGFARWSESSHMGHYDCRARYNPHDSFIRLGHLNDNYYIDNCEFSYGNNGIYAYNMDRAGDAGPSLSADNGTVRRCHLHHIGRVMGRWENDDAHGLGGQASSGWLCEFNLVEECSTCIEFWSESKPSRNNIMRDNVCQDTHDAFTYASGIAVTANAVEGDRTGYQVNDNVIINTDGSGLSLNLNDPITVRGNLLINCGNGPRDYQQFGISAGGNAKQQGNYTDNVVVNSVRYEGTYGGGGVDVSNLTFNNNLYWDDAGDTDQFRAIVTGGGDLTFAEWQGLGNDLSGQWADPRLPGTTLPSNFDEFKRDMFLGPVPYDVDGDGIVTQWDLDIVRNQPVPNRAYERLVERSITGDPGVAIDGTILDGDNAGNSFWQKLQGGNYKVQMSGVNRDFPISNIKDKWTPIVVIRDGSDNVEVRVGYDQQSLGVQNLIDEVDFTGLARDDTAGGSEYDGDMGDVVVADAVLSEEEIAGLLEWGRQQGWE